MPSNSRTSHPLPADLRPTRPIIGLVIVNLTLLLLLLAAFEFGVPVFAAMFADFGAKLPSPTQFVIDVAAVQAHGTWVVGTVVVAGAAGILHVARARSGAAGLHVVLRCFLLIQAGLLVLGMMALMLPVFDLGKVVGEVD